MSRVWGLVVTYQRPNELRAMLAAIGRQSRTPDGVWVVDNGEAEETEKVVSALGVHYVRSGENLGPAGGIALGMRHVMQEAADDDWLMLFDDDDPPPLDTIVDEVSRFGDQMATLDPATAGVGALGAQYIRKLGVWRRFRDHELSGALTVDVIHGGRFPCYRVGALRHAGVFDSALFFGFEEGEFGLRLRKMGYSLYIDGSLAHRIRDSIGQLNLSGKALRTPVSKAAWRRYYGVRNSTILARRYGARWTPLLVALGGFAKGSLALAKARRPWPELSLPARGALDGLRGRTGRTINPLLSTK